MVFADGKTFFHPAQCIQMAIRSNRYFLHQKKAGEAAENLYEWWN